MLVSHNKATCFLVLFQTFFFCVESGIKVTNLLVYLYNFFYVFQGLAGFTQAEFRDGLQIEHQCISLAFFISHFGSEG
ncbi:hypothetical protein LEP1GSC061_0603 [Leptospira wolffii serovar Khorat str. Khorat-H2]|nr:hypothetical protein LEP1GSC061_0603 [Leptospira wolffii serovar Khorat str. Khorat-H2]